MKKRMRASLCAALLGWSPSELPAQAPEIAFSFVPPQGSSANLVGSTLNARPADHGVAIYIYVQGWWNKPTNDSPVSIIAADGTWSGDITTGGADAFATEVRAFLIPIGYDPPVLNGAADIPIELESAAIAEVRSIRRSPHAFHFSGYDWDVKMSGDFVFGPGPNVFSDRPENVWVDSAGRLHLRITLSAGQWRCAEVISDDSFGYGTYRFYLDSPVDAMDPNVVLGIFTWSNDPASAHREIDVEISRWSNASDPTNAQFVVQPWNRPGNLSRWTIPVGANPTTHSFNWQPDRIDFESHHGAYALPPASVPTIAEWSYAGPDVPVPGDEQVRLNLWLVNGLPPTDGEEVEVVFSRFVFSPSDIPAPRFSSFSLTEEGSLQMDVTGIPQLRYLLESSFDLETWVTADAQIAPEADFRFTSPLESTLPAKFYRVQAPDPSSASKEIPRETDATGAF